MIVTAIGKITAAIAVKIAALKRDAITESLDGVREGLVLLAKELSISNGSNSENVTEKLWKSRPIPACRAYHTSTQTLTHGANTVVAFNTNYYDDLSERNDKQALFHSTTTNNSRFYAHEEGKYRISASVRVAAFGAGVTGMIELYVRITGVTGTQRFPAATTSPVVSNIAMSCTISTEDYMFPGEYAELLVFQSNSATTDETLAAATELSQYPCSLCISGRI